jgi:hypothetical protein
MAVQVDPLKSTLKSPGIERLKLKYDESPSKFAFEFNLRRCIVEAAAARAFDDRMATALQVELHFCGHGQGGSVRSCEIGFDVPKVGAVQVETRIN